ncbi:MAG TPA: HlyC/CorC family transporter [Armatimonadetes bacterium]|nr:HlyC/CorC family transporter [Armatimonadota bacterium]
MILASLTFKEKTLKEVMVPRVDLIMLPEGATVEEAAKLVEETGKSRFPIYRGARDEVIGVVHVKDIIACMAKGERGRAVGEIKREALFLPETMPLHSALKEMQRAHTRMALVVDEYGGVEGAVTVKDLLEELVGEIRDEHEKKRVEESVKSVGEGIWTATGRATLREVAEATGMEIESNEVKTIAGLVMDRLGRLPRKGDEVKIGDFVLKVEEVRGRRIEKVSIRRGRGR